MAKLGLVAYVGEKCPHCGRKYKTMDDLNGTKFGLGAKPVHAECWNDYTGTVIRDIRALADRLWNRIDEAGAVVLTTEDRAFLAHFVTPTTNEDYNP